MQGPHLDRQRIRQVRHDKIGHTVRRLRSVQDVDDVGVPQAASQIRFILEAPPDPGSKSGVAFGNSSLQVPASNME